MAVALINSVKCFIGLPWLIGPILDKELRVSSRRARNYILRFAYLIFLMAYLVLIWLHAVDYGAAGLFTVSRMARAGKTIISSTVWFQFCATQIVVVIMLSSSVSEEVYNRTLGLLMTTPISSFQIVTGKLLSKLLQLILLLAISLPVLAIVRIFGGVPWGYVVSSVCITLTSMVFFGSVSLFFSIFTRRAYVSIILISLTLGALLFGIPYLIGLIYNACTGDWPGTLLTRALFYDNPVMVLIYNTQSMMSPGGARGFPAFYWPLHCGIMLGGSLVVLTVSVIMVRRVALSQAIGQRHVFSGRRRAPESEEPAESDPVSEPGQIRRVAGAPVIWKEFRSPLLGRRKVLMLAAIIVGLIGLCISYLALAANSDLDDQEVHMVYAVIFLAVGLLFSIVLPATSITSEKEARSWPLLLATTLGENQMLFGKFVGTLRRCLPAWCLLLGHVFLFCVTGLIHPVAFFQTGILITWLVTFLSGTGLYFGSVYKHTTTAVMMNFAFAAVVWAIVPLFLFIILEVTHSSDDLAEVYMDTNPFIHAAVIMDATVDRAGPPNYDWPASRNADAARSTAGQSHEKSQGDLF
jgi:ABC-type transport system involved in multi-copper enzyme maturation permease subunit